jgi:hypothetical protein
LSSEKLSTELDSIELELPESLFLPRDYDFTDEPLGVGSLTGLALEAGSLTGLALEAGSLAGLALEVDSLAGLA